jgi:hypothetical protein
VIEFEPDAALLKTHLVENEAPPEVVSRTLQLFKIVNAAIPHGYGHASFLHVSSLDELAQVWLGRIRLTLKRALAYDKSKLESVLAEIDQLTLAESVD